MDWRRWVATSGRAPRLQYWQTYLAVQAWVAVMWATACFIGMSAGPLGVIPLLMILPALAPSIAVTIRRLHDRNKVAWWGIPLCVVPTLCQLASAALLGLRGSAPAVVMTAALVMLAGLGLALWGLVEIGFVPGTRGDNRYGPDPLGRVPRPRRATLKPSAPPFN